jgi:Domain of unknown function (DUF6458)
MVLQRMATARATAWWGLTARTIPSDGVAGGLQRFQPRRLILAAVGAENRNRNAGHRVLLDSDAGRIQRTINCRSILEEASRVSLGVSIFLLVVGAILTFAVDVTTSGFNINTVGIILMVAGALGLVLSLLFWSSFSPYRRGRTVAGPDTVVEERRIERDLP